MTKFTMKKFKEWIEQEKNSKKVHTLGSFSIIDFYRFLFPKREPRCKQYNRRPHGYKKHFYEWAKNVWRPFLHKNAKELGKFLTNFAVGGSGIVMFFKLKREKNDKD